MKIALVCEPQHGLNYRQLLEVARSAESQGIEAVYRSDHYGTGVVGGQPHATDAWTTLAGLARETTTVRLGTLVSPVTFRLPGPFAKMATTVNEMSDGRVDVGVGMGWNGPEHRAHGIPFPPSGVRSAMLRDTVEIMHGLWREPDGWSYVGTQWSVDSSEYRPRLDPDEVPRIIIGGWGKPATIALAADLGDEYNLAPSSSFEASRVKAALLRAAADRRRNPRPLTLSLMTPAVMAEDEKGLRARLDEVFRLFGVESSAEADWLAAREGIWLIGTPSELAPRVRELGEAGVDRIVCQNLLPLDTELSELIAGLGAC